MSLGNLRVVVAICTGGNRKHSTDLEVYGVVKTKFWFYVLKLRWFVHAQFYNKYKVRAVKEVIGEHTDTAISKDKISSDSNSIIKINDRKDLKGS